MTAPPTNPGGPTLTPVSTFTLDTSGVVALGEPPRVGVITISNTLWEDLSPFEQGYTARALEEFSDKLSAALAEPLFVGFSDLAPETLAAIRKDCADCIATRMWGNSTGDGALFWTERQSNFDGFEGDTEVHLRTTWAALTVTLGDDGKVVFS